MIEAGKLNRRIQIEKLTETQNARGEPLQTYSLFLTCWASLKWVQGVRSTEKFEAQKLQSVQQAVFGIRYRPGFDTTMRVKYRGQVYRILAIDEPVPMESLNLVCEAYG